MEQNINIIRIQKVYEALGDLQDKVVFAGGAAVSMYADRIAFEVRPTEDVDIVVQIYSRYDYTVLEDHLRKIGFKNDSAASFIGRYYFNDLIVDVMPLAEEVLGFSNRWYEDGFKNAINYKIEEDKIIKIFSAPYFVAAKLEAFKSRGKNKSGEYDGRVSDDFEDIIFILENRLALWDDINKAPKNLREYLYNEFMLLSLNPYFEEWIDCHASTSSPAATPIIIGNLKNWLSQYSL
jgi:predicted nucleotidyltransferase